MTVTLTLPWWPFLTELPASATVVADGTLATVIALLSADPARNPTVVAVTRTEIFCAASAPTRRYVVPVAPAIAAPLRSHW